MQSSAVQTFTVPGAYADAKNYLRQSLGEAGNTDFWYAGSSPSDPGNVQWQMGGPAPMISMPEPSTLVAASSGIVVLLACRLRQARRRVELAS